MFRCLVGVAFCALQVATAHAAMNPNVKKISGVWWAGEPAGPVRRVLVEKERFSYPSGVAVAGPRFKLLEEMYSPEGRIELRTRYHGEERQRGFQTNEYVYDAVGRLTEDVYSTDGFARAYIMRNSYDALGRLSETVFLNAQNQPSTRHLYDYDDLGRCTAKRTIERDGSESRSIRYTYKDRDAVKPSEETTYDRDGRLELRTATEYTPAGDLARSETQSAKGFFQSRTTNTYDAEGRLVQTVEETRQQKKVETFDAHGNSLSEAVFDTKGKLLVRSVLLYVFDRYGNWTHCYELRTARRIAGVPILVPYEVSVKTIDYWDEPPTGPETKGSR